MVLCENMAVMKQDVWGPPCRMTSVDYGCDVVLVAVVMYHKGWVTIIAALGRKSSPDPEAQLTRGILGPVDDNPRTVSEWKVARVVLMRLFQDRGPTAAQLGRALGIWVLKFKRTAAC